MPHDSPEIVKKAYRRLVLEYHPDTNTSPLANQILAEINEAYEVLSDPDKKRAYDLTLYRYLQQVYEPKQCPVSKQPFKESKPQKAYIRVRKHTVKRYPGVTPKDAVIILSTFFVMLLMVFLLDYFHIFKEDRRYKQTAIQRDLYTVNFSGLLPNAFIPDKLFRFQEISQLDLSHNQLQSLPSNFSLLRNLKSLKLNHNQITFFPDAFAVLKNLVYLNISSNPLQEFPEAFLELPHLKYLWAENCGFKTLPITKKNYPKLELLFLKGNPLTDETKAHLKREFPNTYIEWD